MARFTSLLVLAALVVGTINAASFDHRTLAARSDHAALAKRVAAPTKLKKRCPAKASKPDSSTASTSSAAPTTQSTPPAEPPVTTHKPTSTSIASTKKPTTTKPTVKPSPPPPPPPSKPPPPSGKVGLSWTDGFPNAISSWTKGAHIGGAYNWGPNRPQSVHDAGIPFFPMLWGDRNVGVWLDTVVKGYGTIAFGCNEVNQAGQSQMDPSHGVTLWRQQMMPLAARGYRLGSHSVSNAPSGKTWFQQFFDQCPECKNSTDYMQAHYYGTDPDNFISYITDLHDTFGIPIIVTEWACQDFSGQNNQCSMSQVEDFMAKTTAFMNKTSWVVMYFWFGLFNPMSGGVNPDNGLMDGGGKPNALGRQYIGL